MKKLVSILLCLLMAFAVVGCVDSGSGGPGGPSASGDPEKTLDIAMWNSGYGYKWVEALKAEYIKDHPDVIINIDPKSGQSGTSVFYNTIEATGTNINDLYFAYGPAYLKYVTADNAANPLLEDLSSVINYTAEGESKSIAEKFGSSRLDALKYNDGQSDKYYALSFSNGVSGIVYNAKKFDEYGLDVPRTTDELIALIIQIQEDTPYKGVQGANKSVDGKYDTPFIHYPGYWASASQTWWLQYDGIEAVQDYWNFEGIDIFNMETQQSKYQTPGIVKSQEVLYDIIAPEGVTHAWSNLKTYEGGHNDIQNAFIKMECALMYPCGGFLETEMQKLDGFDVNLMNNFKMMRMPVISAVKDKLSAGNRTEIKLRELIDYVDAVAKGEQATKPSWATDDDVATVEYARFCKGAAPANNTVLVPSYSPAKELAKDFLKFMYSDKGLKIFAETQRVFLAVEFDDPSIIDGIDKSAWTNFAKSCFEMDTNQGHFVAYSYNHNLRYRGGLIEWLDINGGGTGEYWFTNPTKTDRKTVPEYLDNAWTKMMNAWQVYLSASGLTQN